MRTHRVVSCALIVFAAFVSVGAAPASPDRSSTKQVIWRDVAGASVSVVSFDAFQQVLQVVDAEGQMWFYDYAQGVVTPESPGLLPDGTNPFRQNLTTLYYQSSDCTGPSYITPFVSRSTVGAPRDPSNVRIIPDNVTFTQITAVSVTQGIACEAAGGFPLRAIRFDNLPHARPRGSLGSPPFHPEAIGVDP